MTLYVTVAQPLESGAARQPGTRRFDVDGAADLTGTGLASALRTMGHAGVLYLGQARLDELPSVPGAGHLFLTPFPRPRGAHPEPPPVWLVTAEGPDAGLAVPLHRGCSTLGRGACDVRVMDASMSRHHAEIVVDGTSIILAARTARAAASGRRLAVGDDFVLGGTRFLVSTPDAAADRRTPPWPLQPLPVDGAPTASRPWLMLVGATVPVAVGTGLAIATGLWYFLAFSALGLFTGGLPALSELRGRRRFRRRLRRAIAEDRARLDAACPTLGELALSTRSATPARGGPDHGPAYPLRVGRGEARAAVEASGGSTLPPIPPIEDAPVLVDMTAGSFGVIDGPAEPAAGVLRAVVGRLACNAAGGGWELWLAGRATVLPAELRRVSGVRCLESPAELLRLRRAHPGPATVVLPSPTEPWASACAAALDGAPGPAVVALGDGTTKEPSWRLDSGRGTVNDHLGPRRVSPDRMGFANLAALAEVLADDGAAAGRRAHYGPHDGPRGARGTVRRVLPASAPLDVPEHLWNRSAATSLHAPVGLGEHGVLDLDLVADGPHLLVAGTTGSGKSELVRVLVLGLAAAYPPREVALMLVDFKGGATLSSLATLPHCQSLVTDLHVETAERTLDSLRGELVRRERLLEAAGASDYAGFRERSRGSLPRLVVVVDEFRVLTDELPGALGELMRIAAVGRSLGVHLVLATQRPQGAVSSEMRANINSVLCLRVLGAFDSNDLIGSGAAAAIPTALPGRGFFRRGGEAPVPFQSFHAAPEAAGWSVVEVGPGLGERGRAWRGAPDPSVADPAAGLRARMVGRADGGPPARMFSPSLPERLDAVPGGLAGSLRPGALPLGVLDMVEDQTQRPLDWDPDSDRRLALVGGPASGVHSALRQLAEEAVRREPECHVYVLDGARALSACAAVPRVAGHVGPDEPERVADLLGVLERRPPGTGAAGPAAPRLLLVTGLAEWASVLGPAAFAQLDDRLTALARRAASSSLSVVVAGDRDLTSSRFFSLAEHRVYCPYGLGPETVLGWPRLRRVRPVPGRAVWVSPGAEPPGVAVQLLEHRERATPAPYPAASRPMLASRPLPREIRLDRLVAEPRLSRPAGRSAGLLSGVAAPDNAAWTWAPDGVGLVIGRPGGGKTGALLGVLHHAGKGAATIGLRETGVHVAEPWTVWDARGAVPELVVVDDATELTDGERRALHGWFERGARVVMAASPSPRLFSGLPLAAHARDPEAGLLLNPRSASDGDFWGWRVQPLSEDIPGRGLVCVDGTQRFVQCALYPDPAG